MTHPTAIADSMSTMPCVRQGNLRPLAIGGAHIKIE